MADNAITIVSTLLTGAIIIYSYVNKTEVIQEIPGVTKRITAVETLELATMEKYGTMSLSDESYQSLYGKPRGEPIRIKKIDTTSRSGTFELH